MPFYLNMDLAAYELQQQQYDEQHAVWEQSEAQRAAEYADAHAAWQLAHDEWETSQVGPEPEEPLPPAPTLEPQPPVPPSVTYTTRELSEAEEIATPFGTTWVMPPSLVVSGSDDTTFGMTPDDFARSYTEATL